MQARYNAPVSDRQASLQQDSLPQECMPCCRLGGMPGVSVLGMEVTSSSAQYGHKTLAY